MGKQKKKRNKSYQGAGASITRPTVTKMTAVNRNAASQWWFDRKRFLKPALITGGVVVLVIWLIVEFIRASSGF